MTGPLNTRNSNWTLRNTQLVCCDGRSQYYNGKLNFYLFSGIERMREEKEQQELLNKENEDAYRIKKGTYDLLPQADENIEKLKVCTGINIGPIIV